jgi:hypothetical protein
MGSLSSSGMSGGRVMVLAELANVLGGFDCCLANSNEDWSVGRSDGSGRFWRGRGVCGVGVDVVDRELSSGVSRGWYTGDIGEYCGFGIGARGRG